MNNNEGKGVWRPALGGTGFSAGNNGVSPLAYCYQVYVNHIHISV